MRLLIREIREKKGISLDDLAEKTGLEKEFLYELENNRVELCQAWVLAGIADALDVKVRCIFEELGEINGKKSL